MRFSREFLKANLRKRGRNAPDAGEAEPKRPCPREARSSQPSLAIPEAILREGGEGGGDPPLGIPIEGPPAPEPAAPAPPPAEAAEESTWEGSLTAGEQGGESAPGAGNAASPEIVEISPPGGASSKEKEALPARGTRRSPAPQSSQPPPHGSKYQSQLSETVLSLAVLPKFQALLRSLPVDKYFDTLFTSSLQMANGLFVVRDDLLKAQSRAEELTEELCEVRAQGAKAQKENQVLRERAETAEREMRVSAAKLGEALKRLVPAEEQLGEALLKIDYAENRADTAEANARDAAQKQILAEKEASDAVKRAAEADQRAQERVNAAEAQAQDRVSAAETMARERIAAAELSAREAVELYKGSPAFASEFSEAATDAFAQGFDTCKERLSRIFKLGNLEHIRATDDEEAEGGDVQRDDGTACEADPAGADPVVQSEQQEEPEDRNS